MNESHIEFLKGYNRLTFSKDERLYLNNEIENLFDEGKWFSAGEFAVIYKIADGTTPRLLISVPKKNQRFAWQRNQSKRVVREVYRQNKKELCDALAEAQTNVHFAIICKSRTPLEYHNVESKIILTLRELIKRIS